MTGEGVFPTLVPRPTMFARIAQVLAQFGRPVAIGTKRSLPGRRNVGPPWNLLTPMSNQPNWSLIAGIVMDAVGTLIKPVPSVADAYMEAARRQGVELNRDEVRARFN